MIDPNLLVIKPVGELENVVNPTTGEVLYYDGSGDLKKTSVTQFFQMLNAFAKPIKTTDSTPTVIGWYKPTDSGLYNNAGGLIAQEGYDTLFYYSGTMWTRTQVKMPESSSNLIKLAVPGTPSINLFNINDPTIQNGKAVNGSFVIIDIADFKLSGWISVEPNTQYTWLKYGLGSKNMQYTDASKTGIGGLTIGASGASNVRISFTTPLNCFGIYYTCKSSAESETPPQMMLVKGNGLKPDGITELDFVPYGPADYTGNEIIAQTGLVIEANQLKLNATINGVKVATLNDIGNNYTPLPSSFNMVVASGSSITNGIGSDGGAGIDVSKAWTTILQTTLSNVLGRAITVVNGGVNGQNTAGMNSNLPSLISSYNPQIVIIEASINDAQTAGVGLTISQTIANLTNMIDMVKNAGRIPILTTPMPIDLNVSAIGAAYTNQKRSNLAFATRLLAKQKNIRLIDLDKSTNNDYSLLVDGLHPNPKGYLYMANAISSEFV